MSVTSLDRIMIRRLAQNIKNASFSHCYAPPRPALTRRYGINASDNQATVSYRQHLKQLAKVKRTSKGNISLHQDKDAWELTVGIEIHAALDTERKLFSAATTSINETPNSHVELFDLSYPGSQPIFQLPTLLPALRAALALNCEIQRKSTFDRKHYFYPDQPAGYQITQFYEPFAKNGFITLYPHDGIAPEDGESITVGIKQIQLEQDTAKSLIQSISETFLDFNRVSHPLIEIISLPQIHHPATAAAYVRKIQRILKSVGAVTAGMEVGGLRADVNVSIRKRWQDSTSGQAYAGITGLGQRTEIKNLGSIKAVEDAVAAEMRRQARILDEGGVIEGETRGWSIGGIETHKLREKEGEVDYRYMPDPDIGPLVLSEDLVEHLKNTMPKLQDQLLDELTFSSRFGLTSKDALTLINLDNGERLEYYFDTVYRLEELSAGKSSDGLGKLVGNWILHEIGALLTKHDQEWNKDLISSDQMALILNLILSEKVTTSSAKLLLSRAFSGDLSDPVEVAEAEGLIISEISDAEYHRVLDKLIAKHSEMVDAIKVKGQKGKIMWFVGQAMRKFKDNGKAGGVRPEKIKSLLLEKLNVAET